MHRMATAATAVGHSVL